MPSSPTTNPRKTLTTQSSPSTSTTTTSQPPPPFTPLPPSLTPLTTLPVSKSKIYILHLDPHTPSFKRLTFAIPVLLNLTIAALLCWRVYLQIPWYLAMIKIVTEGGTAYQSQQPRTNLTGEETLTWMAGLLLSLRRALTVFIDFALVRVVLPWPMGFFFERPGNPVVWRWKTGFRERELVVRGSRGWGSEELMGYEPPASTSGSTSADRETEASSTSADFRTPSASKRVGSSSADNKQQETRDMAKEKKRGNASPYWTTRVAPFITPSYVRDKTGYAMMNAEWDVDFNVMTLGAGLLDRGEIREEALRAPVVLAWDCGNGGEEEGGAWVVYIARDAWTMKTPAGREKNASSTTLTTPLPSSAINSPAATTTTPAPFSTIPTAPPNLSSLSTEEQARTLMHQFEAKLTSMGKESLFYRWVELMQYEASLDQNVGLAAGVGPGSMPSVERRRQAVERVRKLFESEGVEYDGFIGSVVGEGGIAGIGGIMG